VTATDVVDVAALWVGVLLSGLCSIAALVAGVRWLFASAHGE
jgi:hypothetical protein